jgi:tetratricopeptide (TPR) repeat protein/DNA-binding CsgD family transcriptional regulator
MALYSKTIDSIQNYLLEKAFRIILILYFLMFGLSNSYSQKNKEISNLNYETSKLAELFEKNPDQFYIKASKLRVRKIQDKESGIELYMLFSRYYYDKGKYDSMVWSMWQAKALIEDPKSPKFTPVLLQLATAHFFAGNPDSTKFYQNKVSDLIDNTSTNYAQYLLVEGLSYQLSSDYVKAIATILEASKIFEKNKDMARLAITFNNLSINYEKINRLDLQLEYLLKAVSINQDLGNSYHLALNYNNLGVYFKKINKLEKAVYYYELAYRDLVKVNSAFLLAQNLTNRANIYELKKEYELAEKFFLECETICKENGILYGQMLSAINLGNLYRIQKKFGQSKIRLNQGLALAKTLKAKREEMISLERLFWLARDIKDFSSALSFQTQFHALNDSIVSESVQKEANALKEKYEVEKKENDIIRLLKEKLTQQYFIALLLAGIFLLLAIVQWFKNKYAKSKIKLLAADVSNLQKQEILILHEREIMEQTMNSLVLKEHLNTLLKRIEEEHIDGMDQKIKMINQKQNPWDEMIKKFKLLHPQFINKLNQDYPQLSKNDIEFCSLIRMNLSSKEISSILRITTDSVFTKKYRILKKLNLNKDIDLNSWINSLVD